MGGGGGGRGGGGRGEDASSGLELEGKELKGSASPHSSSDSWRRATPAACRATEPRACRTGTLCFSLYLPPLTPP
jgi:hypothetical protein